MTIPKTIVICRLGIENAFGMSDEMIPAYPCKEKCFHFDSGVCCFDGEDCKPITYVLKEE